MDQNEKLAAFGVTHVIASDGFSGKIVGAASMPVKNNVIIYDEVYRWLISFILFYIFVKFIDNQCIY